MYGEDYETLTERYRQVLREAYPPAFQASAKRLEEKDASDLEDILQFLEADPVFYGSGYTKEWALKRLKQLPQIPPPYAEHLQNIILHQVDTVARREFKYYGRLAVRLDNESLRVALHKRIDSQRTDPDVKWRAKRILAYLPLPK